MNLRRLLKIAQVYYELTKEASIKSDMALRIFYSTIPAYLNIDEQRDAKNKLASPLVEGAANLIKWGTQACYEEMQHCVQSSYDSGPSSELRKAYDAKDYKKSLELMVSEFKSIRKWASSYGGLPWANIAETLLTLYDYIVKFHEASSYEEKDFALRNIIVYMNIFDGLAHNTASVMPKLIRHEYSENNKEPSEVSPEATSFESHYYTKPIQSDSGQVSLLMDAKELNHIEDVLYILQPYLQDHSYRYFIREYLSKFKRLNRQPDPDRIKSELSEIRETKEIMIPLTQRLRPMVNRLSKATISRNVLKDSNSLNVFIRELEKELNIIDGFPGNFPYSFSQKLYPVLQKYNLNHGFHDWDSPVRIIKSLIDKYYPYDIFISDDIAQLLGTAIGAGHGGLGPEHPIYLRYGGTTHEYNHPYQPENYQDASVKIITVDDIFPAFQKEIKFIIDKYLMAANDMDNFLSEKISKIKQRAA